MPTCQAKLAETATEPDCIRDLDGTGNHVGYHDDGQGRRWFDHAHTPSIPDTARRFLVTVNHEPVNLDAGLDLRTALNVFLTELGEDPDADVEITLFDAPADTTVEARPVGLPRPRPATRRGRSASRPLVDAAEGR